MPAQTIVGELNRIAESLSALHGGCGDPAALAAGPLEKAFIRYSIGTGTFHVWEGAGYIVVNGEMYKLDGVRDGNYQAVFRAWFPPDQDPSKALTTYPSSSPPYDQPSPVEHIEHVNDTKAKWTFGDGSALWGPGPAVSYIAPLRDGGFQFWVSAAAFLSGGSGKYENAIGQETSLGSTYFSGPPNLVEGTTFDARVLHSFKVILGRDRAPQILPVPGSKQKAAKE